MSIVGGEKALERKPGFGSPCLVQKTRTSGQGPVNPRSACGFRRLSPSSRAAEVARVAGIAGEVRRREGSQTLRTDSAGGWFLRVIRAPTMLHAL